MATEQPQGMTLEQMGWKIGPGGAIVHADTGEPVSLTEEQAKIEKRVAEEEQEVARRTVIRDRAMSVIESDPDLGKLMVRGADYQAHIRLGIYELHELMIQAIEFDRTGLVSDQNLLKAANDAFDEYGSAMPANSDDMRPIVDAAIRNAIGAKP